MKKLADDNTIRLNGIEALNRNLGPVDALRFLSLFHREPTDYVEISRRLYNGETVEEILKRVRKRANPRPQLCETEKGLRDAEHRR